MSLDAPDVYADPLFVGLTRPAMLFGVPYGACVAEGILAMCLFLATSNPFYLLVVLPSHAILYLVSAHDPGIFSSIEVWAKTVGRCRNRRFWRAASFSPTATRTGGR